jgi:hypothetical protein
MEELIAPEILIAWHQRRAHALGLSQIMEMSTA